MSDETPDNAEAFDDSSPSGEASPSAANAETEPIDPARPAEDDAPHSAHPPDGGASDRSGGAGVTIPSWLAGALVVVLALVIAAVGFAIGRATDDDDRARPIVATEGGGRGSPRAFPIPGGRGELPDFPDFPGRGERRGEGPRSCPGGPERTFPHDHDDDGERGSDDRQDEDRDDESDDDSEAPGPPELPGT